jgi:hypothetical protein
MATAGITVRAIDPQPPTARGSRRGPGSARVGNCCVWCKISDRRPAVHRGLWTFAAMVLPQFLVQRLSAGCWDGPSVLD